MASDGGDVPPMWELNAMKRRSIFAAAALVLAFAIPGLTSAAAPTSPFTGSWEATDGDGSHETLVVSSGARPSVVFQDYYASGCDSYSNLPATHFTAAGKGDVDGDRLWVEFHKSGCGTFLLGGYGDYYDYDAGSDTLIGTDGIVWTRTS
jgi:hypothetical protein